MNMAQTSQVRIRLYSRSGLLACMLLACCVSRSWGYANTFFGALNPFSGQPAGPVTHPQLGCLNTVAGPPFNYRMRCPDTANVSDYFDERGTFHRVIEHAPLPGVTAAMIRWWFSPATAVVNFLPFRGQLRYWYKIWHPIDHDWAVPTILPSPDHPALPALVIQLKEHYRALPQDGTTHGWVVDAPLFVSDARIGAQMRAGGLVIASFLNRPWYDSPQGARTATELIVGVGNPVVGLLNKPLVFPILDRQLTGLVDQLTRHNIEEFGNFVDFLPELYNARHNLSRLAAALKSRGP